MTQIGAMRHRVTIQHPLETRTDSGHVTHSWKDLRTVWADVRPLSGRELLSAQQVQSDTTHKVTIRYMDGVDNKNRLVWSNNALTKTLEVTSAIDVGARERFLELMCREVV